MINLDLKNTKDKNLIRTQLNFQEIYRELGNIPAPVASAPSLGDLELSAIGNNFGLESVALVHGTGPGTITLENGSSNVVGNGTKFTDASFKGLEYWYQIVVILPGGVHKYISFANSASDDVTHEFSGDGVYDNPHYEGVPSATWDGPSGEYNYLIGFGTALTGYNSVGFGYGNTHSNNDGAVFGQENRVTGERDVVFGKYNITISGVQAHQRFIHGQNNHSGSVKNMQIFGDNNNFDGFSGGSFAIFGDGNSSTTNVANGVIFGSNNTMSRQGAHIFGSSNTNNGTPNYLFGNNLTGHSGYEFVFGQYNTIYTPNSTFSWDAADRLVVIGNGTGAGTLSDAMVMYKNGQTVFSATVAVGEYTVATLPVAPATGSMAYVTDATAPTYLGTLTGGGAVVCPVFYNGTAWVSH